MGDVVTALAISLLAGNLDSTSRSRAICKRWRLPALELGIGSSASVPRGSLSKPGAADRSAAWSIRLIRDARDYALGGAMIIGSALYLSWPTKAGKLPDVTIRRFKRRGYITGGTAIPIRASVRINSRRTTATVDSRNCLRASSGSLRMGWRW